MQTAARSMPSDAKEALTLQALGLLNEQIQARIVHYKSELETSPELDAITAQVVTQLKTMQAAVARTDTERTSAEQIETQQAATLARLLTRHFSAGESSPAIHQNIKTLGRRIAKLFFESELHEKTKGDKEKVIHHAEQGVYYVLSRYKNRLRTELEGFEYVSEEMKEMTFHLLAKMERDLQVGFLSRRSPELNRVMMIFTTVLSDFFQKHLPPRLEQMARITLRAARSAHQANSVSYKVQMDCFEPFREEWERVFMQQMVNFCGDEILSRLTEGDEAFRDETVRFFTDPHIFSETCEVLCDALYDYLCMEGFLDLPMDWRMKLSRENG